jgi:hypothetical protein
VIGGRRDHETAIDASASTIRRLARWSRSRVISPAMLRPIDRAEPPFKLAAGACNRACNVRHLDALVAVSGDEMATLQVCLRESFLIVEGLETFISLVDRKPFRGRLLVAKQ